MSGATPSRDGTPSRAGRAVPLVLTVLAGVAQVGVLIFTFLMGLQWGGPTYYAALLQAVLALVLLRWVATRKPAAVLLVPVLSAVLTGALAAAGTEYGRAVACGDEERAAAEQLTPLPGTTLAFEGHELEGCLAVTRMSRSDQAIVEHYETELVRLGWRLTPHRIQGTVGIAAERDGTSLTLDVRSVGKPDPDTLEVVVGQTGPPLCAVNTVSSLQRRRTTTVQPGTWAVLVSSDTDGASVLVRDATSAVVFEQEAQRRQTSGDTLREKELPDEVPTLRLSPGTYQVECRRRDAATVTVPLRVAWSSGAADERDREVSVSVFRTPEHWR